MMQITDPIHGYIELDGIFADIVNTPEFQRLRSVEQGSFRPVYPGARHDRFSHSLGTYHLAKKFLAPFFRNLKADAGISLPAEQQEKLEKTFLYAALLHDIGHAPFSHTTEDFFAEKKGQHNGKEYPQIWLDLCAEVNQIDPNEGKLFFARSEKCGASHEIMSATILVGKWERFHKNKDKDGKRIRKVDLPLAARMVIGFAYEPGDLPGVCSDLLGVRNCLIQLLNCSVLDVDRLDYMGRDARMSGFVNAALDLDCLAQSVTAVRGEDGMPVPAYRESALRVFDLMFQAKLSHDAWVLAAPAGAYDAALLAHCIRQLPNNYIENVFTVEALSREGVDFNGKRYRLLSDVDVAADLKAQGGKPFDELWTRELDGRRIAAWRSYYEYHHLFNCPEKGLTPEKVYVFFRPLLEVLNKKKLFVFNEEAYQVVCDSGNDDAIKAAKLLREFLMEYENGAGQPGYNVVLLERSNNFTLKLDPEQINIVFPKRKDDILRLPLRSGKYNYSTYAELTGNVFRREVKKDYFYLMKRRGLGYSQLEELREMLAGNV